MTDNCERSVESFPENPTETTATCEYDISPAGKKNIPFLAGLPIPPLTANLRHGSSLHDALLGLLPLVGVWRGKGQTVRNKIEGSEHYEFGQELIISHDGNDYLSWSSVIWESFPDEIPISMDDPHEVIDRSVSQKIIDRETGFIRISDKDEIQLLLSHSTGFSEVYYGTPLNNTSWELATDAIIQTSSEQRIGDSKRLYGLVNNGDLAYVEERKNPDGDFIPLYSAQLFRYAG